MKSKLLMAAAVLSLTLVVGCFKNKRGSEPEVSESVAGGEALSQSEAPKEERVEQPAAPVPSDLEGEPVSNATP